jgi:tripartite-type tricarboxylate transporter receptor subunit TctC
MDPKIVDKLARSVNAFLADPAMRSKLEEQYLAPIPGTPAGIRQRGENEAKVWGGLIRSLGIQAD